MQASGNMISYKGFQVRAWLDMIPQFLSVAPYKRPSPFRSKTITTVSTGKIVTKRNRCLSVRLCQTSSKSLSGGRRSKNTERKDGAVAYCYVFICNKLDVLDIPAILTSYENILPGTVRYSRTCTSTDQTTKTR